MSEQTKWWVYMIKTQSGRLYTGITTDIDRRFKEHQSQQLTKTKMLGDSTKGGKSTVAKSKGAKFFRTDAPIEIVYREQVTNRSDASKREAAIKKLSRLQKNQLVG